MLDETDKKHYMVYVIDGVTFLPHYQNSKKYVSPGYPYHTHRTYEPWELQAMGGKTKMEFLWRRAELGKVKHGSL